MTASGTLLRFQKNDAQNLLPLYRNIPHCTTEMYFADLTINLFFPCRITSPRSNRNSIESGLGDEKRETDNNTLQVESVQSLQYKWSARKKRKGSSKDCGIYIRSHIVYDNLGVVQGANFAGSFEMM